MNHKEIFEDLVLCKLKGVMFHSEMVDYYAFLKCHKLKMKHHQEMLNDLDDVRKIKDYYLTTYQQLITLDFTKANIKDYIPSEWDKNTLTKDNRFKYITDGIEIYYNWEKDTHEQLVELQEELFNGKYYDDFLFVRELAECNMLEKSRVHHLQDYIEQIGMNVDTDEGLKYRLD